MQPKTYCVLTKYLSCSIIAKLIVQGKPFKLSVKDSGHYEHLASDLNATIGSIYMDQSFIRDEVFIWKGVVPNNKIRKLYLSQKHGHV